MCPTGFAVSGSKPRGVQVVAGLTAEDDIRLASSVPQSSIHNGSSGQLFDHLSARQHPKVVLYNNVPSMRR